MNAHTPGPWTVRSGKYGTDILGYDEKRGPVAVAAMDRHDTEANANLIAAAPELLEELDNVTASLETVMAHFGQQMPAADRMSRERVIAAARAAIAKATNG